MTLSSPLLYQWGVQAETKACEEEHKLRLRVDDSSVERDIVHEEKSHDESTWTRFGCSIDYTTP